MKKNYSQQHLQQSSPSMTNLQSYKSIKDFRKSKEQPKFKFTSEIVKEILNPKSEMYRQPNVPHENDIHQRTWKQKMSPLAHPRDVRQIQRGIQNAKSDCYNLLQRHKNRTEQEIKERIYGKDNIPEERKIMSS